MIVEKISYNQIDGTYDSTIFTAEKNSVFSRAYRAKKNVQDYVFADGYARDGQSVERKLAENMDLAGEVCVYAKLPRGFSIPTPVGNYSPDWAIAFYEGAVKHIFFVAETKGTILSKKKILKAILLTLSVWLTAAQNASGKEESAKYNDNPDAYME